MAAINTIEEIINEINKSSGLLSVGIISDTHIEEFNYYRTEHYKLHKQDPSFYESIKNIAPPTKKLDVLIVVGDFCEARLIDQYKEVATKISEYAKLVIFIDGNHESWGTSYQKVETKINTAIADIQNAVYLRNDFIEVKGVEIFGSCLWTDFGFNDYIMASVAETYPQYKRDRNLQKIKWNCRKVKGYQIQMLSVKAKKAVVAWIENQSNNKKLLATHYPPYIDKVLFDNEGGNIPDDIAKELQAIDFTDISKELSEHPDVVVAHGHLHYVGNYTAATGNKTYCNPRGCFRNKESCEAYRIEEFTI